MGNGLGRDGIGLAIAGCLIAHPCTYSGRNLFCCNPGRVCFGFRMLLVLEGVLQGTRNDCKTIYSY